MSPVLHPTSEQKARGRLTRTDPSIVNGLDDDPNPLLSTTSTKWLETQAAGWTRRRSTVHTARHRLQLYPDDAPFVAHNKAPQLPPSSNAITIATQSVLPRPTTVLLLSPSSTATALAATARSKQEPATSTGGFASTPGKSIKDNERTFHPAIRRAQPAAVMLFEASMLNVADGSPNAFKVLPEIGTKGSTKTNSNRMRRRGIKPISRSDHGSSTSSEDDLKSKETDTTALACRAGLNPDNNEDLPAGSIVASAGTWDAGITSRLRPNGDFDPLDRQGLQSSQKTCYICVREFNVLRKRHSCPLCSESICRRCSVYQRVKTTRLVETKLRICTCCFVANRMKQAKASNNQSHHEAHWRALEPGKNGDAGPENVSHSAGFTRSLSSSNNTSEGSTATLNTVSDVSLTTGMIDDATFASSRPLEDELNAVFKANELEKKVKASQRRIHALEAQIATQESQQDLLSVDQHTQLQAARATIKQLQDQLCLQEGNARQAASTRDSICLSKLRQTEVYTTEDDENDALKKKLRVLERQLEQAGIPVAEIIPYTVAKTKVAEISLRLQAIGSSEVVLDDKHAQAAARKEYYLLEQEMEKYHMALVMTDEYREEQRREEQAWEDANACANMEALRILRSVMPVDIAQRSERALIASETPTGVPFTAALARRLKRTNVLQLVRIDPKTIVKMHPSVVEGYRTTGLSVLERRALHAVMQEPFRAWKQQHQDDMAQRKYAWYHELHKVLRTAVVTLTMHRRDGVGKDDTSVGMTHKCTMAGLTCPVRMEEWVHQLYSSLGFTPKAEYATTVCVKSDPEGAGEKALLEVQGYVRDMVTTQRQRDLKMHYKTKTREFAQAASALEEMDTILDQVRALDAALLRSIECATGGRLQRNHCDLLLRRARELMHLLAERASICVMGKRLVANDTLDTRSPVEIREARRAMAFLEEVVADVEAYFFPEKGKRCHFEAVSAAATFTTLHDLMTDVRQKNSIALGHVDQSRAARKGNRVAWTQRQGGSTNKTLANDETLDYVAPAALPTTAPLFKAIKARRKQSETLDGPSTHEEHQTRWATGASRVSNPFDLMAAIRARKRAVATKEMSPS